MNLSDLGNMPVSVFSAGHLVFLAICIIFGVVCIIIGRKLSDKGKNIMLICLLAAYIILDMVKFSRYFLIPGAFNIKTSLPFHLCSIAFFIYPLAVFTKNLTIRNFIYGVSMPGAFFALVTPDIQGSTFFGFHFVHSMLAHTLIFFIPIFMVACGFFRPDYKKLPKLFLMLLICMIPAVISNYFIGSNYFFINGVAEGTFTETLANIVGEKFYILPMVGLVFILWALLFSPYMISDKLKARKEAATAN